MWKRFVNLHVERCHFTRKTILKETKINKYTRRFVFLVVEVVLVGFDLVVSSMGNEARFSTHKNSKVFQTQFFSITLVFTADSVFFSDFALSCVFLLSLLLSVLLMVAVLETVVESAFASVMIPQKKIQKNLASGS